jgi:NADPH:quinone reductase-like Zn-dependent oxidoreductase
MPKPNTGAGVRTRECPTAQIPETMRAIAIDRFGGPEVLKLHALPVPLPGDDEVLVAVHTAGVGPWDAEIREGWIDSPARFPLILGTDGSGTVAMAGSRVRRLRKGDRVYSYSWANPKGGFYAQYVAVTHARVAPFPGILSMEEARAVATTGLTALQGIDNALALKSGEIVVIHGAAGGVGSLAIQIAKLRGAQVLATATTDAGLAFLRRLGADHRGRHARCVRSQRASEAQSSRRARSARDRHRQRGGEGLATTARDFDRSANCVLAPAYSCGGGLAQCSWKRSHPRFG